MEDLFGDDDDDEVSVARRPPSCGVMAFHNGTEESMFVFLEQELKLQPSFSGLDILEIVDRFCYSRHWMMHLGDKKRVYLTETLQSLRAENRLRVCVELGSYCGYSALCIAHILREIGDSSPINRLYCIERSLQCVAWTKRLLALAGLLDYVEIIQGEVNSGSLEELSQKIDQSIGVDLLFVDHDKKCYLSDLQLILASGLLRCGSRVVADNILSFGVPLSAYLTFVNDPLGPFQSSHTFVGEIEYVLDGDSNRDTVDGVEVSICK